MTTTKQFKETLNGRPAEDIFANQPQLTFINDRSALTVLRDAAQRQHDDLMQWILKTAEAQPNYKRRREHLERAIETHQETIMKLRSAIEWAEHEMEDC